MHSTRRLRLSEVNPHLVCVLCGGYFIDATTIVECLHSFCRSCLIKYLECNSFCPICDVQIHKAKPFLNIKPDKALQDIVYKLVPGLFHSEMRRRREFYAKHPERIYETTPEGRGVGVERLIYSPDDSISLSLEYLDGEEEDVSCTSSHSSESSQDNGVTKRYLQCPALVTIGHLKKFLRIKYELAATHAVEIVHRRESLPDDYTLMDVAYIYTWKRNGPMRFFFRIIQSPPVASPVVQSTPSITNGSTSVKESSQVSSTQSSSQSVSTVSHSIQPTSSNSDHVSSKSPPKVESPKPAPKPESRKFELQNNVSVGISMQSSVTDTLISSETVKVSLPPTSTSQSTSAAVTKCNKSISVPVTNSSPLTCAVAPTKSNQTTSRRPAAKETNKPVTKTPSHPSPVVVAKTEIVAKTTPSLPSSTSNMPFSLSDTDTNDPSAKVDPVAKVSLEDPPLATEDKVLSQNVPAVTETKSSQQQCLPITEQSIPKTATKDITPPSTTTKIPVSQQLKENNQEPQSQQVPPLPSGENNLTQKPTQISNGVSDSETSSQPPSDKPSAEVQNCMMQSQDESSTTILKTEHEETTPSSSNVKVLKEDSQKSVTSNNSTVLGNPNTPKSLLSKKILQRLQNSARKPSMPMKYVSDPSSTKASQATVRHQSQLTKDSVRFSRINQKPGDKQFAASDITASKKENAQVKSNNVEKNETVKEPSHISTNLQTKTEKDTLNSATAPHTPVNNANNNNNINKVPPQNQQIIRNNQQILRKNDEIMRCVTTIKRPIQPIPRKTSDVLKNSAQLRTTEDKLNAKKRRLPISNPMKRPAPTALDASKMDEVQPAVKKSKPIVENNRKTLSIYEQKVRFPNTLTGQSSLYTAKSESTVESSSNGIKNDSSNTFNTPIHVSTSENKCNNINVQEIEKKNCVNEKAPPLVVHRPQPSMTPKLSVNSAIKKESPSTKPDIQSVMRRSPASTQSGQNMVSPPMPVVAHSNINPRLCPTPHPPSTKVKSSTDPDGTGALDLSSSPRRQQSQSILSIAQTLARRHQQQCPSPAPPPLSPLSSLSPFPVMPSIPVRSPPPQLRIPIPPQHRTGHSHQQQRPSSLSSSSPSPPADTIPGSSRMGPPQQQQPPTSDMYPPHLLNPAALMFRQQLELQRLWGTGKHNPTPGMEWFSDANSIKRFESFMKSLQQQQQQVPGRNSPFYPFNNNNNTAAAANNHRK